MKEIKLNIEEINEWPKNLDVAKNKYQIYNDNQYIGFLSLESPITEITILQIINSDCKFFIPSYQRGYRWDEKQVNDLLNDINDWDINTEVAQKYCLQPIVLKDSGQKDYDYTVVDGQQRLTTIFIILKALKKRIGYQLKYDTRENSAEFLNNIENKNSKEANANIDFHYMYEAYKTAVKFFKDHNSEKWYEKLTHNQNGAFFIEYKIISSIDDRSEEDIFDGLNAGKIALTDAELIKAQLLNEDNFDKSNSKVNIFEVALEWDRIERKLRNENFWSWLGQKTTHGPRINYIFNLYVFLNKDKKSKTVSSYYEIMKLMKDKELNILNIWNEVRRIFMRLEDWYEDLKIYHIVGFLNNTFTNNKKTIVNYFEKYVENENYNFKQEIIEFISSDEIHREEYKNKQKNININDIDLDKYDYNTTSATYDMLLLFNIITSINTKNKFDFASYLKTIGEKNRYDLEHIYPSSDKENLPNDIKLKEIISAIKKHRLYKELLMDIKSIEFDSLEEEYKHLINLREKRNEESNFDSEEINSIGNLCLLDSKTNSSYKNYPFPIKVEKIIETTKKANLYILPTTKNAFLKYYSKTNLDNFSWTTEDAEQYQSYIELTIKEFLKGV